ncbi:hypothetical protein [Streptomyces sp. SAJ15]|uniref:hypothetical protein n=1 Tax=Streptomyces sp. SAJ15 TaxID=2011095 RepID=UPI0016426F71|nr:hypothetical protein [Streptomyces sp. SAJ15]
MQIAAVSETQTKNTWVPLLEMLQGPVLDAHPGLEPMDTFVSLPRGRIEPITSSARTVKGNKPVFAVLDQALALDTPIPAPAGWLTMGSLQAGDLIFGSGGLPVKVTDAKPVSTEHDCFEVTFADGTSMVSSAGHLWWTKVRGSAAQAKVRTTGEMFADGRAFRIPVAKPFDCPEADLSVPPYLLGLWLGDGTRGKCEISVHGSDLEATQANLAACGVESWPRRYEPSLNAYSAGGDQINLSFTRAKGFAMKGRPAVAQALSRLPCYRDKHVPAEYLMGSIAQRTALMQGLMDSDGCCTTSGTCTFINTNRCLAEALVQLLRSLGQVTSGAKWVADERYTGGGKFRVDFTPRGGFQPFLLPRKARRVRQHNRSPEWITITSIRPVPRVPVRCIAVDSEDHLFAAGVGGHLTHNTEEWVRSNRGNRLAETMRINAAKVGGTTIESPNAFIPGEGSVAEESAAFWAKIREGRARDDGLYYDHREAPPETDMTDRHSLLAGLAYTYGDSADRNGGHVDLDVIVATIWDPSTDPQTARADFLNQITHASDSWISQPEWAGVAAPEKVIGRGEEIVLGFDGSRRRSRGVTDATALVGCRVSDGHLFLLGCWEQPDGPFGADWQVPTVEVLATVEDVFREYRVVGMYADPAKWESHVATWEAKHGRRLKVKASVQHPIEWWMTGGRSTFIVRALEKFRSSVVDGELTHDGSSVLTRHILNARRRESRSGIQIMKEHPDSPKKIDAAVAAVLAWQCRVDAMAKGLGKKKAGKGRVVVLR